MFNNHQSEPVNMLTKIGANQPRGSTANNESINQHQHQHQIQHQLQQPQQDALTTLFRSLSSLAHGGAGPAGQSLPHQTYNIDNCPSTADLMNLTLKNVHQTNEMNAHTSSTSSSISTSLHGMVAAAALMQQQLVTANMSRERQTMVQQVQASPHLGSSYTTISQSSNKASAPFLGDPLIASYPQVSQPLSLVAPAQEVQYSISDFDNQQQQQQPHQQRINYCTICNKELCNKYFMKTHMLKMHGINLETSEQSGGEDEQAPSPSVVDISKRCSDEHQQSLDDQQQARQSANHKNREQTKNSQSSGGQQPTTPNKCKPTTTASSSNKAATSVMNGFAGNSMGGVVCDICNKELCSKYFLKVHKQNTHGIATDLQDAGQFVYPFANNLPNPFMPAQLPLGLPTNSMLPFSANTCFNQTSNSGQSEPRPKAAKKTRSMTTNRYQPKDNPQFTNRPSIDGQQLDSIYRIMMNQQPQRQPLSSGNDVGQSPLMGPTLDPVSANQMGALMCLGTLGSFGPASISPAMVVEMILRNQHLINRSKGGAASGQGPSVPAKKYSKDKNNNDSKQAKGAASAKSTKDSAANSSRYFTHYTEACPMCDRRFKSIKWLKTHMMNDHKQEIATYMQMMVQNLLTARNQPTAPLLGYEQAQSFQPVNFSSCNVTTAQHHQQQHSQATQPISYDSIQAQTSGIIQAEQFSVVQNYLNQQRQMIQQHQIQLHQQHQRHQHHQQPAEVPRLRPESAHSDHSAKLMTLNEAHRRARESSSSSSGGMSPQSVVARSDCVDDNQQLNLSMKLYLDAGQPQPQERRPDSSKELDDDNIYSNDYDENSSGSSCNRDERDQSSATKAIETNDSTLI